MTPQVGDILDYGDGYRKVVASVNTRHTTKVDFRPNPQQRFQYRDIEVVETVVWTWGDEPTQVIAAGGGTLHVLPVEEHLTLWENPYSPDKGGDTYPPPDAQLIRDGRSIHPKGGRPA